VEMTFHVMFIKTSSSNCAGITRASTRQSTTILQMQLHIANREQMEQYLFFSMLLCMMNIIVRPCVA
jgi:hypothetical protein